MPPLSFSRWLMQRRNVLLPEPDGPDDAGDGSRRHVEIDPLEHFELAIGFAHAAGEHHRVRRHTETRAIFCLGNVILLLRTDATRMRRRITLVSTGSSRLSLRPKWRSRKCWPIDMMLTTARYQKATTISSGMVSKVRA